MSIIIGNIFGGLSTLFLGISVHKKSSNKMLRYQIIDCSFAILSCLFLGGYNGIIANISGIVRNILKLKNKTNKVNSIIIVVTTTALGILSYITTENNTLAMLPIIASAEYTISICYCNNYRSIKIALLLNESLWFVYLISIRNYIESITMSVLCVNTIISLYKSHDNSVKSRQQNFEHNKRESA